jgi:hypothetical protein
LTHSRDLYRLPATVGGRYKGGRAGDPTR